MDNSSLPNTNAYEKHHVSTRETQIMYKDVDSKSITHYQNRIANIQEDSVRRWGSMSPAQMLAHVRLLVESSLGELSVEGNGQIPFKWVKHVILSGVMPFPKAKLKAPSLYLNEKADNVVGEQARLAASLQRFVELCDNEPNRLQMNPVFGMMTMPQWARLHGLHLNHHLNQFGV